MIIPSIQDIRKDLTQKIVIHIMTRPGLMAGIKHPFETAKLIVSKWKDTRCRFIYITTFHENKWMTIQEVATRMRVSKRAAQGQWQGLRGIKIQLMDGRKTQLFRRGVEMRFRHAGIVDGQRIQGGILLHLQYQEHIGYHEERTITQTTESCVMAYADNYQESIRRQSEHEDAPSEEREASLEKLSRIVKGPQGEQLNMFGTGMNAAAQ